MKKLTSLLIASLLLFSVACEDTTKTTVTAPEPGEVPATPAADTVQASKEDAQSETRRRQLNADIRAREERNLLATSPTAKTGADFASQVRSKLEANIPAGQLTVNATDTGIVTVSGTVSNQDQLAKIEPLAKEISGVTEVIVNAVVAPPTPR